MYLHRNQNNPSWHLIFEIQVHINNWNHLYYYICKIITKDIYIIIILKHGNVYQRKCIVLNKNMKMASLPLQPHNNIKI